MKIFKYTLHNIIGHPLMELFNLFGMKKIGTLVHDKTLPREHNEN